MKKKILITFLIILLTALLALIVIKYKYDPIINSNEFTLEYKHIGIMQEDYIAVSDGEKFGYYNIKKKKLLTKIDYQIPDSMKNNEEINLEKLVFIDGLAPIANNNKIGLINTKGEVIIKPTYEMIKVFNKDLILVYKDSNYYFINSYELNLFNLKFETVDYITNNIFIVYDGANYRVIDNKGKYLLENKYDEIQITNNDETPIIKAINNETTEYYLIENKKITKLDINKELNFITNTKDKIYFEDNNGMYQIYDINNKKLTKLSQEYIGLGNFINGIAQVINEKMKIGYINESEELIIPFEYDYGQTSDFNEYSYASVEKNGLVGVINTSNQIILPLEYIEIYSLTSNTFLVTDTNNKTNIINKDKTNLTNNKYTHIYLNEDSEYLLTETKKDNKSLYGIINNKGEKIIEPKYKNIKIYNEYFELKEDNNKYTIKKKSSL